ncbi:MAG TPA: HEAT repeat domain-containing protein [Gemmataceae bacterium]
MTYRRKLFHIAAVSVVAACGCTDQPKSPPPGRVNKPVPVTSTAPAAPDVKTEAGWLAAARDPDPAVRQQAVMAVSDAVRDGGLKSATAAPVLLDLLRNDPDDKVRWLIPTHLSNLPAARQPAAVAALSEAMLKDRHEFVRSHSAMALSSVAFDNTAAARPALPALTAALKDKAARTNAAMALNNFGREATPAAAALLETLKDRDARRNALNALQHVEFGPAAEAGVPALVECLKDNDNSVRRDAAVVLRRIGPPARAAVPALVDALQDKNDGVREWAAKALKAIDPERAIPGG